MEILNNYWVAQTATFLIILVVAVFMSAGKKQASSPLPKETSNELRGLAILGVLFAHLTYGKFYGTEFLFPVGIWGGIAVDLFFLLSGYGLAASAIYHAKTPLDFYKKRLLKIFISLWLSLLIVFVLDALLLNRFYPFSEIMAAFFGFFPVADLWQSVNSPLWFLTPLLFYYFLFPFIFRLKHPFVSILLMFLTSILAFWPGWPVSEQIAKFYQLHCLAFPSGFLLASLLVSPQEVCPLCGRRQKCWFWLAAKKIKGWLGKEPKQKRLAGILARIKGWSAYWRFSLMVVLFFLACYFGYFSSVGRGIWMEQSVSLLVMVCVLLIFIIKKTKFRLLEYFGIYSMEIYLLHWPLVSRYDIFFKFLPPAWATIAYLATVMLLAVLFNRLVNFKFKKTLLEPKFLG